jgi:hypothetical protein
VKLLDEGLCLHQKILPTVRTTELESKPNFTKIKLEEKENNFSG